jgi:hypothetical protein
MRASLSQSLKDIARHIGDALRLSCFRRCDLDDCSLFDVYIGTRIAARLLAPNATSLNVQVSHGQARLWSNGRHFEMPAEATGTFRGSPPVLAIEASDTVLHLVVRRTPVGEVIIKRRF